MPRRLPIPAHFNPATVGQVWRVPYEERAAQALEWARIHELKPSGTDKKRVCLLLIDCQNTFCIPEFELFVRGRSGQGAVDDNTRLCRFIYENLQFITEIRATLDTHKAAQIFHSLFWINEEGEHPTPMTVVSVEDVETGAWRVNPDVTGVKGTDCYERLCSYALHYVRRLRERGKYDLIIWPYHAILGGIGHALVSAVEEAMFFHTVARRSQAGFEIKGDFALTEHYSVLSPEVDEDQEGNVIAERNASFLNTLLEFDAVVVAGQAKSHCLAWTMEDLLAEMASRHEDLAKKVYLLEDCTSPVVVPDLVDFTEAADGAFQRFADAGVNVVRSTEPVDQWPGGIFTQ